jgi:hypothetical protein
VLLTVALVLVGLALPSDPADAGDWLADGRKRDAVLLALNLLPFAGIAFLWFIGVVRDRIGAGEDRFFATVFLGSGLLFIAMVFAAGALAGGIVLTTGDGPAADVWSFGRHRRGHTWTPPADLKHLSEAATPNRRLTTVEVVTRRTVAAVR